MKRFVSILFIAAFLFSASSAYASSGDGSYNFVTVEKSNIISGPSPYDSLKSLGGIQPRGGSGYSDAYYNAVQDYSRLPVSGIRIENVRIIVKILNGHFFQDVAGRKTMYLDRADSQWTNGTMNCDIISTGNLITTNNTNWSQNVQIKGNPKTTTYSQTLTKNEATTIVNQGGIKLNIAGYGEVSTSSQVSTAYGSSTSKTVTVSMTTSFTMWFTVKTDITGLGTISATAY